MGLEQIEHFIVLTLENRSFDHMLGYLEHPDPTFDGVGKQANPPTTPDARYGIYPGPDHSHAGVLEQILGTTELPSGMDADYAPTMSGFAANYERHSPGFGNKVMRCFHPRMVPVLSKLALEYAVCDRWFCSLPGETFPNRDFLHAGTSFGQVNVHIRLILNNPPTTFRMLETAHESWRLYHSGIAHLMLYVPLLAGHDRMSSHDELIADIENDRLPSYAWVEPDYGLPGRGNSQHPSQARSREEFVDGERFIAQIYAALRANPHVFEKTAFIITYDEHGGFYDHVPPVDLGMPDATTVFHDGDYSFAFKLTGPRVPAVVVSPWIPRHTVSHTPRDHSCVGETLRQRFASNNANVLNDRAEGTGLGELFTLDEPRRGDDIPPAVALSYEAAIALEQIHGAAADVTDETKQLDVAHQTAIHDLIDLVRPHLPF